MQWRVLFLVFRIYIPLVTDQIANADLTAEHGSVMEGCPTLIVHRIYVYPLLNEVANAHRLVPLGCHVYDIHTITVS